METEPRSTRPEVSAGMAAARARGVRLGRPTAALPPATDRVVELHQQGLSLAAIAATLTTEQAPTPSGRSSTWSKSSVQYVLARWAEQQPTDR